MLFPSYGFFCLLTKGRLICVRCHNYPIYINILLWKVRKAYQVLNDIHKKKTLDMGLLVC